MLKWNRHYNTSLKIWFTSLGRFNNCALKEVRLGENIQSRGNRNQSRIKNAAFSYRNILLINLWLINEVNIKMFNGLCIFWAKFLPFN